MGAPVLHFLKGLMVELQIFTSLIYILGGHSTFVRVEETLR
jgi:hypothetical protein